MRRIFQSLWGDSKEPLQPDGLQIGEHLVNGYELRSPSQQNAIDLIPGWTTHFPPETGVVAGGMTLLTDVRLSWAMACYGGDLVGKQVAELGPLEGAHTFILDAAGARVDAIESSGQAYLKCLITKEILGIKRARFMLGDCVAWLEDNEIEYDLVIASGILYHMTEPLRLLQAMAARSDDLYIWTMFIDNDGLAPHKVVSLFDIEVRHYRVPYGARTKHFCGGAKPEAMWLHKDDIHAVLKAQGFRTILASETERTPYGAAGSIYASRRQLGPAPG